MVEEGPMKFHEACYQERAGGANSTDNGSVQEQLKEAQVPAYK